MKKKVINDKHKQNLIKTGKISEKPFKYNGIGFAIDVSFEGLYYAINCGNFMNFCQNEHDFLDIFKSIRELICKVSTKDFHKDLIRDKGMKHCHLVEGKTRELVVRCIKEELLRYDGDKNYDDFIQQVFEGEYIYQIGFEGSVRLIGTYDSIDRKSVV